MIRSQARIRSVLVFGAKDHIGSAVVRYFLKNAPDVRVRLVTHTAESVPHLRSMFPDLETVVADLLDTKSLISATEGMEGIFQISPDVFNEDALVDNMAIAHSTHGNIKHIVRILGIPPGATMSMVPTELMAYRYYPAMQHLVALERYRSACLPVSFVNVAGYYMDDFIRMFAPSLFKEKTIKIAFDKRMAWIDPVDVGDVSAEILISEPEEYYGKVIDVTGSDLCTFSGVADLFTNVLGTEVTYCGDVDEFFVAIKPLFTQLWGEGAPEYFMKYFKWETDHAHLFKLTPHVQNILKRTPKSLAGWIDEHRNIFMQQWDSGHEGNG